ncbi:ATP-binding cassette domain-containing protein [Chelativorans sp. YIM 93263]|uniref:ATP-binding cassette domain-containing protein n=1 Tax=Chelativorans sp. YIM 93263 TaxID=2906648 RepID=UPI0023787509|nr:ATP-binding cassette domain-containing protein [Chelativorans sp. YIM 93263]
MPDTTIAHSFDESHIAQAERSVASHTDSILPVSVTDLAFTADGKRLVYIDRLTLRAGGSTIIMGPNGAGKSLLLRLLHGLIGASEGTVLFNSQPMSARVRRRQAMVFQRPVVLRRSVRANIDYALSAHGYRGLNRRERLRDLLEMGELADMARQRARTLSGGEQQRLALVRAVAASPDLLFLDEPTSSLDPASTHRIEALIRRFAEEGTKIVMVTHDLGQARRLADEIVFMHHGKVTEQTPANVFFDRPSSPAARDFITGGLLV